MGKICFIVGHGKSQKGGYDSGAVSGDYHEFKIAKEIAKYAHTYYNANYNETADLVNYKGDLSLPERINKFKDNTYEFIAEIHLNAGGGTGTECYYYHDSKRGQQYADKICDYISKDLGVKQRTNGTDKDGGDKVKLNSSGKDYFGIIRDTKPTAVLIETVFIDTADDLNKVKTAAGQKKCGEAIAKAIAEVRGIKKKATVKKETASSEMYRVRKTWADSASQKGAFTNLANAKKVADANNGYKVFNSKGTVVYTPTPTKRYFKRYTGKSGSIVDSLKAIGVNSTFAYRSKIAKANGITVYASTASQNIKLLNLLKQGKLIMP